jgi:hypothetical protein
MESASACRTLSGLLDSLVAEAAAEGIAIDVAHHARSATLPRMGVPGSARMTPALAARAGSYFRAVVRRRAVRRGQPARGASRFVIAAIVEDLRASGREGHDIWSELQRGWAESVPEDVLEEYRLRLCG